MKQISTERAPAAIGPYSQGVKHGELIFISGQLPVDPLTGKIIEGEIQAMTTQVINNIEAVLKAAGSGLDRVIRTEVFLLDLKDFAKMNEIYAKRFSGEVLPTRQTIQVGGLPLGASIEISCIATSYDR